MENVKFIKNWFNNENNGLYFKREYLTHVLCDVLTRSERATFNRAIKNGGFVTFGDDGLHACCNPTKENVKKFFKKHFNMDYVGEEA